MSLRRLLLPLALIAAFTAAPLAHAQQRAKRDATVLPVWNNASGRVEAYLVLEPTNDAGIGGRWRFGSSSLESVFKLNSGDSLGLLCNGKRALSSALVNLPGNCLLATVGDGNDSRSAALTSAFSRGGVRIGATASVGNDTLPTWLAPGNANGKVDLTDLTVFAQKNIASQGYVSIAGTVAKARLLSPAAAQASGLTSDEWTTRSLSVGGRYGAFGANIVGAVVDTPGQAALRNLGLGVSWRTPWSGEVTVGADRVTTEGKNPFSTSGKNETSEDTVPYVRYKQDL